MQQYLDLLRDIRKNGTQKADRTGTGTLSVFGRQMRFNLQDGFPLLTTKSLHLKSIIHELLWFLSGDTNIQYLNDNGVSIWNEWADKHGNLGPIYGKQWRSATGEIVGVEQVQDELMVKHERIDQIANLIDSIKNNPNDRGHIVSAWNVSELRYMRLRPCHALFQCDVSDGKLSLQLYQRSCDTFLGVPFNIASYALLTHMLAQQCNLEVGDFIWTGGDVHLYLNHLNQAKLQLSRLPGPLPTLSLRKAPSIFEYKYEDIQIGNYYPHPAIPAPVSK